MNEIEKFHEFGKILIQTEFFAEFFWVGTKEIDWRENLIDYLLLVRVR